jgi:hypothetical protein
MSTKNSKPQLHQSMLDMLSKCGIQFQRRYGARFGIWDEEEIIPPGIALGIGISTHKAIQCNLDNKIRNKGEPLPREEVKQIARDAFMHIWRPDMINEDESTDLLAIQGAAVDMTVALSDLHYIELAPRLNPVAVEEPFVIELKNYPFDVGGQIDVRELWGDLAGKGGKQYSYIRDAKTSAKSPSVDATRSMQMAMYAMAHEVLHGRLPDKIFLDFLVKTKTPKLVVIEDKPMKEWINPLYHRIERFAEIIDAVKAGKQALTPADTNSWICTEKYCGYTNVCPFWSGR